MKKDKHKTKVSFMLERDEPRTVYAYFPNEIADGEYNRLSYAHVGQHSSCSVEYANECSPATPAQYADLKTELESIGYNLEVI